MEKIDEKKEMFVVGVVGVVGNGGGWECFRGVLKRKED